MLSGKKMVQTRPTFDRATLKLSNRWQFFFYCFLFFKILSFTLTSHALYKMMLNKYMTSSRCSYILQLNNVVHVNMGIPFSYLFNFSLFVYM